MKRCFRECYANDLRTTTCSGVLGHRTDLAKQDLEDHTIKLESYSTTIDDRKKISSSNEELTITYYE
jgi:hypothetical protein